MLKRGLVSRCVDAARKPGGDMYSSLPSREANMRASFWPAAEPLRAPTMATMGRTRCKVLPLT